MFISKNMAFVTNYSLTFSTVCTNSLNKLQTIQWHMQTERKITILLVLLPASHNHCGTGGGEVGMEDLDIDPWVK